MLQILANIASHVTGAFELCSYYARKKLWVLIPGVFIWSLLPLFLVLAVIGILTVCANLSAVII